MSPIHNIIADIRRKGAQGLVEFALILPVFLLLVFGIIEAARLMMTYSSVYTASREGARYGAAIGTVAGGAPRYRDCPGIRNAAIANGFLAGVEASSVEIRYDFGPEDERTWSSLPTCPANVLLGDRVVVRIQVTYQPIVPLVNFPPMVVSNSDSRTIILDFQVMGTAPASPTPKATRTPTPVNTPPVLVLPADITAEATSPSGAVVSYTVTANDAENGILTPTCTPDSGSTFPLGTTTVDCSATDWDGLTTNGSFTVTVQDTTSPVIAAHADVGPVEATSASGAAVTYTDPSTSDAVDGSGTASCSPASGSTFSMGTTVVTCTATDSHGNAATPTTFTVTVRDSTGPVIAAHANVGPIVATSPSGAVVTYTSPATSDVVDGAGIATCSPVSGSTFPIGTTVVTCNASDSHGNAATPTTFTVSVQDFAVCTTIQILNVNTSGSEFQFDIQNNDPSTMKINSFTLSWNGTAHMTYATLGSSTIWTGPASSPIPAGSLVGDTSINSGVTKHFEFNYSSSTHSGESVQLNLLEACYVTIP